MLNRFRKLLAPPVFPQDDEKTRLAGILHRVLLAIFILLPTALAIQISNPSSGRFYVPLALIVVALSTILIFVTRAGYVRAASMALIAIFLLVSTFVDIAARGELRPIAILSGAVVVAGGLLLGPRGAYVTAFLYSLKRVVVVFLVGNNLVVSPVASPPPTPFVETIGTVTGYFMIAIVFSLAANSLRAALVRARESEAGLALNNQKLAELTQSLEIRIQERTAELEDANRLNARRAAQFEAVARVTQAVRAADTRQEALSAVADEICIQFNHPYAAIHLLDEENQTVQLRVASRSGSAFAHVTESRRPVNEDALLEQVVLGGSPRLILDDGRETVSFSNPALPNIHSQMLLPLKTGARLIGILDIQSDKMDAFSIQEISAYSVLADQIGIAIENIRLLETARASLEETVAADRRNIRREWARFLREENLAGYRYAAGESAPLQNPLALEGAAQALESGTIRQSGADADGGDTHLDVPVKLRGQPIGLLRVTAPHKMRWSEDDLDIAEVVVERLALALENARLFRASASRAARERIVSDISSRISGNIRVKNILQVAAQELSQALDGSEVLIQLQAPRQPEVEE